MFCFCLLFFVPCFLYNVYHICSKHISKRPAVEPSEFKKQNYFLLWVLYVFCLFYFFIFSLIFGYRSPPPGPDWSHLWSIWVPCVLEVVERRRRKRKARNLPRTCRELARSLQEMQRETSDNQQENCQTESLSHKRRTAFLDSSSAATNAEQQNRGRRYWRLRTQIDIQKINIKNKKKK